MPEPLIALDARLAGRDATGDSTYWTGLLIGLSRINTQARFLLFSNGPRPPEIPDHDSFRWIELPGESDRWWSLVRFPLRARRMGAQVLHTQYNLSPLAGRRGVTTIHDVSFLIEPGWFKPKDRFLLARFVPASARRAARVITVSETSKRDIAAKIHGVSSKLRVTLLALNPRITPLPREEAAKVVQKDLGIERPFLLAVGTRWPRKNMGLAVQAVRSMSRSPKPRLVLPGKPGWGELSCDDCVLPGFVSDRHLSALYSCAELFLAPSFYEGFGLTLLEAFACGCPVVCSAGGAHPEVAGAAARVVESWSPEDWANAIDALLSDSSKLQELRSAGIERASRFRWEDTAKTTMDVYREVIT